MVDTKSSAKRCHVGILYHTISCYIVSFLIEKIYLHILCYISKFQPVCQYRHPGVLQDFLKHVILDYLVRGTDIFFLRLPNWKMTTATTTIAIRCESIKIIPVFCQIGKKIECIFLVCHSMHGIKKFENCCITYIFTFYYILCLHVYLKRSHKSGFLTIFLNIYAGK